MSTSLQLPTQSCSTVDLSSPGAGWLPEGSPLITPRQGQKPVGLPHDRLPVLTPRQSPGHHCTGRFGVASDRTPASIRFAV